MWFLEFPDLFITSKRALSRLVFKRFKLFLNLCLRLTQFRRKIYRPGY